MIHTATALRQVRRAQIDFLLNWSRDQGEAAEQTPTRLRNLLPLEDDKHDWRHLYDGSILDD